MRDSAEKILHTPASDRSMKDTMFLDLVFKHSEFHSRYCVDWPAKKTVELWSGCKIQNVNAGEIIFAGGDFAGNRVFVILSGVVEKKSKASGVGGKLYSGSFFGEEVLYELGHRQATIQALSNVALAYFEKTAFIAAADGRQETDLAKFKFLIEHTMFREDKHYSPRRFASPFPPNPSSFNQL